MKKLIFANAVAIVMMICLTSLFEHLGIPRENAITLVAFGAAAVTLVAVAYAVIDGSDVFSGSMTLAAAFAAVSSGGLVAFLMTTGIAADLMLVIVALAVFGGVALIDTRRLPRRLAWNCLAVEVEFVFVGMYVDSLKAQAIAAAIGIFCLGVAYLTYKFSLGPDPSKQRAS